MIFHYSEFLASASYGAFRFFPEDTGLLFALFTLLVFGEIGIPFPFVLPGTLVFLGYQISHGTIDFIPLFVVLIAGRQTGSAITYFLARKSGMPIIVWLAKYIPAIGRHKDRLMGKLAGKRFWAVVMGRLTPWMAVPTSLVSGTVGLRYGHFAFGVFLSGLAGDTLLVAFGIAAGHSLKPFHPTFPVSFIAMWALSAIAVAFLIRLFLKKEIPKVQ